MLCLCCSSFAVAAAEITPHKYRDAERQNGGPKYDIPPSSRFTTKRIGAHFNDISAPDSVYYVSRPARDKFPIAILVGGSSLEGDMTSIIHVHRYFLKEFLDLGVGVITIEQEGVDGPQMNKIEFMEHYTRSHRLSDHRTVIAHLKKHPPLGWNGKLIFLGVSEGGLIVTTLTTEYSDITVATINWSGAGDFSWRDELWIFMQDMIQNTPWHLKLRAQLPSWMPYSLDLYVPKSRKDHDHAMDETIKNPSAKLKLAGMTYKYHHDALIVYPKPEYEKIKTPYLVVAGVKDSFIDSSDAFVRKAKEVGAPVTYMRISDMDHYVRKREDVINDSFAWLKKQLFSSEATLKKRCCKKEIRHTSSFD
jgi:dienelactone hydrolase